MPRPSSRAIAALNFNRGAISIYRGGIWSSPSLDRATSRESSDSGLNDKSNSPGHQRSGSEIRDTILERTKPSDPIVPPRHQSSSWSPGQEKPPRTLSRKPLGKQSLKLDKLTGKYGNVESSFSSASVKTEVLARKSIPAVKLAAHLSKSENTEEGVRAGASASSASLVTEPLARSLPTANSPVLLSEPEQPRKISAHSARIAPEQEWNVRWKMRTSWQREGKIDIDSLHRRMRLAEQQESMYPDSESPEEDSAVTTQISQAVTRSIQRDGASSKWGSEESIVNSSEANRHSSDSSPVSSTAPEASTPAGLPASSLSQLPTSEVGKAADETEPRNVDARTPSPERDNQEQESQSLNPSQDRELTPVDELVLRSPLKKCQPDIPTQPTLSTLPPETEIKTERPSDPDPESNPTTHIRRYLSGSSRLDRGVITPEEMEAIKQAERSPDGLGLRVRIKYFASGSTGAVDEEWVAWRRQQAAIRTGKLAAVRYPLTDIPEDELKKREEREERENTREEQPLEERRKSHARKKKEKEIARKKKKEAEALRDAIAYQSNFENLKPTEQRRLLREEKLVGKRLQKKRGEEVDADELRSLVVVRLAKKNMKSKLGKTKQLRLSTALARELAGIEWRKKQAEEKKLARKKRKLARKAAEARKKADKAQRKVDKARKKAEKAAKTSEKKGEVKSD